MAKSPTTRRKSKIPDLTEVRLSGLVGGEVIVETMDNLWNWAGDSEEDAPAGVALHVVSAFSLARGEEGHVAALSLGDLDSLIDELTKARDVLRARSERA